MSELFENEEEQSLEVDDELGNDNYQASPSETRRRLESLLAEKKLREELEDFFDEIGE